MNKPGRAAALNYRLLHYLLEEKIERFHFEINHSSASDLNLENCG